MFAAGNEGFHVSATDDGLKTVTSPATSKNCLAAGATNTAAQRSASTTSSQAYVVARMAVLQRLGGGAQAVDNYRVRPARGILDVTAALSACGMHVCSTAQ